MTTRSALLFALATFLWPTADCSAGDWPTFRGPNANGLTSETNLPSEWSAENHLKWKVDVPGEGWACPIVASGKVIVMTAVPDGEEGPDSVHRFEVYCFDLATGDELWKKVAKKGVPRIETHRSNTYASETPVTDGERIVCYFGMTGVFCYDFDGNLLWEKDLGAFNVQGNWGTASSPAMYNGLVYFQIDNEDDSFLVALDAADGEERWRVPRDEASNWSSPIIWRNKERTELVTSGRTVRSYDPLSGDLLWELNVGGGRFSASPAGNEEILVVGGENRGGGGGGRGAGRRGRGDDANQNVNRAQNDQVGRRGGGGGGGGGLFAVRAGANGDVSLADGETQNDGVAWVNRGAGPAMASPLIYDGYIYLAARRGGVLGCYSAETGEEVYRERLPGTQEIWASPIAYDGKIFCQDASGATHVLAAGPDFNLLHSNKLAGGLFWASPAIADGSIVIRSENAVYCVSDAQ